MTPKQILIACIVMGVINLIIRLAPFAIFNGKETPKVIVWLGEYLPYAVIGMLLVYCFRNVTFTSWGGFLPELIAGIVVAVSYLWKRNSLISVVGGTLCYVLLVQFVFV